MGTHELARVVFASPSTIGRLCRKIGFDDYREYQRALACELEGEGVVTRAILKLANRTASRPSSVKRSRAATRRWIPKA